MILNTLTRDWKAVFERDPAAKVFGGGIIVLLSYAGYHAVLMHRLNHFLHATCRIPVIPRLLSQLARLLTGVEIHPGAKIGPGIFIDHGSGVVIGETAVLGEDVTLYQGVTLGGVGHQMGKRHPTLGDRVTVGAGAIVLGNIVVGNDASIGAGSVVIKPVPEKCTVVGVPGAIVRRKGEKIQTESDHALLPDPVAERLKFIQKEIDAIEQHLHMKRDSHEHS